MTTREDFEKWFAEKFKDTYPDAFELNSFQMGKSNMEYGWQACAAHYEAELLKRDAMIAEKDKALRGAAVCRRLTGDFENVMATIDQALSLTHDSVSLVEAARVGKLVNSVCLDSTNAEKRWDYLPIGTKLYTIVKWE